MNDNRYRPILNNSVRPGRTPEDIQRETRWIKEHGYGGFAINGGTREKLRDVSDWLPGYMEICKRYVEEAKKLGLDVWIFDEWGFPSGCACGQVLTDQTLRAKKLHLALDLILEAGESLRLKAPERLVSVAAIPVNRFYCYHPAGRARILEPENGDIAFTAAEKTRLVAVTWEYLSFVTHVMKDYVEGDPTIGTVDILDKNATRRFLSCMHELYVPYIGNEFGKTVKGFFYDEPEICWDFPYTPALDAYFETLFGYRLKEVLPELLAYMPGETGVTGGGDAYLRLRAAFDDYAEAWTKLLADSFYGELERWCHAHNLLSVGHQDLDNHLLTYRSVSGDFLRNSARNDRPGIDVIWDNIFPGKFTDFPRYAGSVKRTLQKSGAMSETFAEMGLSMYADLMRYDMEHQILRGIDQFFNYCSYDERDPNVQAFARAVNDRVTRTTMMMNEGRPGAETAIYIPMREIAFKARHANPHLFNQRPLPWERVELIAEALCYAPVDFDYAWEDGIDNLYERGIRTLILPGSCALRERDEQTLRAFHAKGGRLVSALNACKNLADVCMIETDLDRLTALVKADVRIRSAEKKVSLATRITGKGRTLMLLNESGRSFGAELEFLGEGALAEMDTRDGNWARRDGRCVRTSFAPRELKIFALTDACGFAPAAALRETVTLNGWTLRMPDGTAKKLDALVPWPALGLSGYSGWLDYGTEFEWSGGDALISLGDVRFGARVKLDGQAYDVPFSPYRLHLTIPAGHHKMTVSVLNSNANQLFADAAGPYGSAYQFERAYIECGLIGPVTITRLALAGGLHHKLNDAAVFVTE
jgi:hypothetical protein